MSTHGPSHIKTLYDPSTDMGQIKNNVLTEKIANALPSIKDGCCALLLERPGIDGFFFHFLTENDRHPNMCQKWFVSGPDPVNDGYIIAAILWGAKKERMTPKTKKRPKTGGRQKGSGGVFVRLTIPKETAEQLPSNAKELRAEILDAVLERLKKQRSTMTHTCEFPHPEYGTLILSGQIFQAEPECDLEAHAVLESILTYDGEEMLTYENGNAIGFTSAEIAEMESALLHRGERANRVKPDPKLLEFLRNEMINR